MELSVALPVDNFECIECIRVKGYNNLMSKYRNIEKTCHQNHLHDSIKEASYCDQLELRKKAGDIIDYASQVKHVLVPAFTNSIGEKVRAITYTPDFVVYHDGFTEIIDVKAMRLDRRGVMVPACATQAWKIKWKLLMHAMREDRVYRFTVV